MLKIRHIAFASDHPGKAAEFYKTAFGFRELRRFGLDPNKPDEAPRPSGVFLTDGTLNLAIQVRRRPARQEIGRAHV